MIASWMVYTVVVGMLVSLAAVAAERALLLVKRPVRGVWAAALVLSILIPAVSPRLPWHFKLPSVPILLPVQSATQFAPGGTPAEDAGAGIVESGWSVDGTLLLAWGSCAVILALYLTYAIGVLQGRRREWRRETVDGIPVLMSRDIGPAVIGWRRLDIVVPEWVRDLEQSARGLILRHEMEHVLRQDPRLLVRTWLGLVAMPWNPALWWQLRRLRRAIELDCDARVVASGANVSRYGSVLLEAVGRCNRGGLPAFAAFAERAADLEARIKALTAARSGFWRGRAFAAAATATVLAAAACLMPDSLTPGVTRQSVAPVESSKSGIAWVREQLKGHPPADVVVLYRSHDGRLLKTQTLKSPRPGARPERVDPSIMGDVSPKDVESIEVVRGPALGVPGIDGVIVITLKADAVKAGYQKWLKQALTINSPANREPAATTDKSGKPMVSVSYFWQEYHASGFLREMGYSRDMNALRNRNGRRPAELGVVSRGGHVRYWARYEAP